jgi:hypothetical protein
LKGGQLGAQRGEPIFDIGQLVGRVEVAHESRTVGGALKGVQTRFLKGIDFLPKLMNWRESGVALGSQVRHFLSGGGFAFPRGRIAEFGYRFFELQLIFVDCFFARGDPANCLVMCLQRRGDLRFGFGPLLPQRLGFRFEVAFAKRSDGGAEFGAAGEVADIGFELL